MAKAPLGITLPLRLGQNGYFQNTIDPMVQVRTNLTNLLLTIKGERLLQPEFGSNLHRVIFNSASENGQAEVEAAIKSAVKAWMPFVRIDTVTLQWSQTDEHKYVVGISYTLLTTNISDSITLVF